MYDIFEAHFSRYCYMRMTIQKSAGECKYSAFSGAFH